MNNFITLSCPSCGGKLEITEDVQQFACAHCGTEHRVNRNASIVSITPLIENIKEMKIGVDKTASELAIKRLKEEIEILEQDYAKIYNTRNQLLTFNFGVGIAGLILFLLFSNDITIGGFIFLLFIISIITLPLIYIAQNKRKTMSRQMDVILNIAKKKNNEMKRHEKNVG